ncbi:MAG: hypothetical protein LQ340_002942 [Diploschistes diacapsis]|nr:MAG: hypothetical protein LQ340_002942 [Diploschistes diacapsis]
MDILKNFDKLSDSSHFANDLGLDSLDTVEVVMAIEENPICGILLVSEASKILSRALKQAKEVDLLNSPAAVALAAFLSRSKSQSLGLPAHWFN